MTDTQWLLDLVEEAAPPLRIAGIPPGVISFMDVDVTDEVLTLFPLLARLCVEQHEALKRIADARSAYGIAEQGGARDIARAALARFEELKP